MAARRPRQPWRGALLLTGTALLLLSPNYPWYSLFVVALVALDGRWEWLTVNLAGTLLHLGGAALPGILLQTLTYGAAVLAVVLGAFLRSDRTRRMVRRRLGRLPIPGGWSAAVRMMAMCRATGRKTLPGSHCGQRR